MLTAQISAGELGHDPKTLEEQLSHISQRAHHWKALVLLDEADVFVQARSIDSHQNARVSVFLRKLEYNRGIILLTTNWVRDFDDAIQSRITLAVKYEPLSLATRKQVWISFLRKAVTVNGAAKFDQEELDRLAGKDLNGRQVTLPSSNIVTSVNANRWFTTDQKRDSCGLCVSRISEHKGVHVSPRNGHRFERGI